MRNNKRLMALTALAFSGQLWAGDSDITLLDSRIDARVQQIQTLSNQQILPDALEQAAIGIQLIAEELSTHHYTVAEMTAKYQLDASQQRQLMIIILIGNGGGFEPPQ